MQEQQGFQGASPSGSDPSGVPSAKTPTASRPPGSLRKTPAWKCLPLPEAGQRWDTDDMVFKQGAWGRGTRTARVMAVAEGYIMARFQGAVPFVMHASDWHRKFTLKAGPARTKPNADEVAKFHGEVARDIARARVSGRSGANEVSGSPERSAGNGTHEARGPEGETPK